MPGGWQGSDRASRLPANWPALREDAKRRSGGICEAVEDGARCRSRGDECDHINRGDDHRPENLRWVCRWHHGRKSSAEGIAARKAAGGYVSNRRKPERHPGLKR